MGRENLSYLSPFGVSAVHSVKKDDMYERKTRHLHVTKPVTFGNRGTMSVYETHRQKFVAVMDRLARAAAMPQAERTRHRLLIAELEGLAAMHRARACLAAPGAPGMFDGPDLHARRAWCDETYGTIPEAVATWRLVPRPE